MQQSKVYSRSVDVLKESITKCAIKVEAGRVQREVLVGVVAECHILDVTVPRKIDFGGGNERKVKRVDGEVIAAMKKMGSGFGSFC